MSVTIESAWRLYLATRLHYLSNYDAVKYKGRLNNISQTQQRPDKVLVRATMTEMDSGREVIEFCIANFLNENDNFLYESQEDALSFYKDWVKYWSSVDYMLQADISCIEISMYKSGWSFEEYMLKGIYSDILKQKVRRETLCIIVSKLPHLLLFVEGFGSERLKDRVEKTLPFIKNRLESINVDFVELLS